MPNINRRNPYTESFIAHCTCDECEDNRRNYYKWETAHFDNMEVIDMPCMNCNQVIKNGTGLKFGNGKVCDTCLNPEAHALFHHDTDTIFVSTNVPYNGNSYGYTYFYVYDDESANLVAQREASCIYVDHDVVFKDIEVRTRAIASLGNVKVSNCNIQSTRLYFYTNDFTVQFTNGTYGYDNGIVAQNQVVLGNVLLDGYRSEYVSFDANTRGCRLNVKLQACNIEHINCKSTMIAEYAAIIDTHIEELNLPVSVVKFNAINSKIDRVKTKYCTVFDNVDIKDSDIKFYNVYNIIAGRGLFNNCTVMIPDKMLSATDYQFLNCTFIEIPKGMQCVVCNELIDDDETPVRHKGKFMHNKCVEQQSHYEKNERVIGNKVKLPPFSFELEVEYNPRPVYNALRRIDRSPQEYQDIVLDGVINGFRRCGDCTVTDELKSVIMNNDMELLTMIPYLQEAQKYVTNNCGTHIHVSMVQKAREFYRTQTHLFVPVTEYMKNDKELTIKLWGRYFSSYASDYYNGDRYYWINFHSSSPTVEYRLAKLDNPTQFRQIVQFVRIFSKFLHARAKFYRYYPLDSEQTNKLSNDILEFYKRYTEKRSHALIRREKLHV